MSSLSLLPRLCLLLAVLLSLTAAAPAQAAPTAQLLPSLQSTERPQPVDVVVVLDDSGSMATCWPWNGPPFGPPCGPPSPNPPSDPSALRYSAARLFTQLLDPEDRLAVVRFDNDAEGVGALASLQPVGAYEYRRLLADSLTPPTDFLNRGYTRIDLGLETASNLLAEARQPGRSQYLLLLTDGEPSQQDGNTAGQRARIGEQFAELRAAGVFVFPVVLCNPGAGCAGDFLRQDFTEYGVTEAGSAEQLLPIFAEIIAAMKPDRSILTGRTGSGALQFTTRAPHGVRTLSFVTARGGLASLRRDAAPVQARTDLADDNIEVNVVDGDALASGAWNAEGSLGGAFAVAQTDSFVQLLNPPPSVADSPASVRYFPAGSSPLLLAQAFGPGADEPLLYNGETELQPFGGGSLRALQAVDAPGEMTLQLGADTGPLQLERSFRVEARAGLPRAEVFSPLAGDPAIQENGAMRLQVGFSGGAAVENVSATAYVADESPDDNGGGRLVHEAAMQCADRLCTDDSFIPVDGRSYRITYLIQGDNDGIRFGDWAETDIGLAPAVYVRGLPAALDLAQMPAGGWPIELSAGTTEEIGALTASLVLRPSGEDEPVRTVSLNFSADVPESGSAQATLNVEGLSSLRPGDYEGELTLAAQNPAGRPMQVDIRPGPTLPVTLSVPRPLARLDAQIADFGERLFDTSPNFRLDQEILLPVSFLGEPFDLTATLQNSTCPQISMTSGDLRQADGSYYLPLRLRSSGPVQPATCTGAVALAGLDGDYDVAPARLNWRMGVNAVEWSVVGGDLNLGDLQDAGAAADATLLVRFNGNTPFVVQMLDVAASGESEAGPVELTSTQIEMPPVEISGPPNDAGLYEVPVRLIARQTIPHDGWRGSHYSGRLHLGVAGLPDQVQELGFTFRSPSLVQRYIAPIVVPVYSMPAALCTVPLTLLLLLVLVARMRGRNIDDDEIEQAATAAVNLAHPAPEARPAAESAFPSPVPASAEAVWGRSEWGAAWPSGEGDDRSSHQPTPGSAAGDPWSAGW